MPGKSISPDGASWKCQTRRSAVVRRASVDTRPLIPPRPLDDPKVCKLCQRESIRFTSHHLIPRSQGGKFGPQVKLCPTCHRQLHAMFSESTLAKELNSIEALQINSEFSEYLKWAKNQKGPTTFPVRRAKNRR